MATSNAFLPFAIAGGANVISDSAYAALPALGPGFSSGVASSQQLNKVWRQSSFVVSEIAQAVAEALSAAVVDNGVVGSFKVQFEAAIPLLAGGVGIGQAWANVTSTRALTTTFTNSSGKPILVSVDSAAGSWASQQNMLALVNGAQVATSVGARSISGSTTTLNMPVLFVVPNGATYSVTPSNGSATLNSWNELR